MRILLTVLLSVLISNIYSQNCQREYKRVREAYKEKSVFLTKILAEKNIKSKRFDMIILGLKKERELQIWVKNTNEKTYAHLKTYDFAGFSGELGPKRQQGDMQIPEGLYRINYFNPYSNFHLSMKVSYPNRSDKILGVKNNLGGDIFIHGSCVTIGCIPITDDKIKELYILSLWASSCTKRQIPVYIFPCKMDDKNFEVLVKEHINKNELIVFWKNLKPAYDKFMKTNRKLNFSVNRKNGNYILK